MKGPPSHPRRHPVRRETPVREWPTRDRAAWARALEPGDIFEPGGPASGWSSSTMVKHKKGYGRWLTFLARNGRLDPAASPVDRLTPETVAAYAKELAALNSARTVIGRLEELRDVARVMEPGRDWAWIGRIAARFGPRQSNRLAKRSRLRASDELFALGARLMERAQDPASGTPLERAVGFRDGLIIAFLAARPLRRRTLAGLKLDHLSRRGDTFWLTLPPAATKNRRPIELPLPDALTDAITCYLGQHRSVLLRGRACDALWASKAARAMGDMAIYMRIVKLTRQAFGAPVHPHLFRDAAATSIAIEDPEHVRVAAQILGHGSSRITERHYDQARMIHAVRRYQASLAEQRRAAEHRSSSERRRREQPSVKDEANSSPE